MQHITGYRTTIRPGFEAEYRKVHSRVPDQIAEALMESGLISWQIWIDGNVLFHVIETVDGKDAMIEQMVRRGPIDATWDRVIADLVEADEIGSATLPRVWRLSAAGQSN